MLKGRRTVKPVSQMRIWQVNDGKGGRSQYVAVDGVVYDMTGVPSWSKGMHKGGVRFRYF